MTAPAIMTDAIDLPELQRQLEGIGQLVAWSDPPEEGGRRVQALFTYGHPPVSQRLLDGLAELRVISNFGVGVDHIDVRAAQRRGIPVGHTPGVLDGATADLGFALLLASARNIVALSSDGGVGTKAPVGLGREVHGSALGIVGLGRIGREIARRAAGFGMQVLYHQRRPVELGALPCPAQFVPLRELLEAADFVILSLPLTEQTHRLMVAQRIGWMRPEATLINIARGAIVDTDALTRALARGQLAAAALDVTEPEPLPADHPLRGMPQVILTPHIGSATGRTRQAMARLAVANLRAGLAGQPLPAAVAG
jgi:glyoxylate reductase